jgi:hypothetical protein
LSTEFLTVDIPDPHVKLITNSALPNIFGAEELKKMDIKFEGDEITYTEN